MDELKQKEQMDRLASLSNLMTLHTSYKCPVCGEEHKIDDCAIVKQVIKSEYAGRSKTPIFSTYKMKVYEEYHNEYYYNIRICPKCAKSRSKAIYYAICPGILATILIMVNNISKLPEKTAGNVIGQILLALICGGFLGYILFLLIAFVIKKSQTIDIDEAKKNNAIAQNDLII